MSEKQQWTTSQIENNKNNVPHCKSKLVGQFAGSMNGGMNRTVLYFPVMAGQQVDKFTFTTNIQILTPKTPAYQRLYVTYRTYKVPNERVWKNYLKFIAQKGGNSVSKIQTMPNFGGKQIPIIYNTVNTSKTSLQNMDIWRDSFASDYIPRMGTMELVNAEQNTEDYYIMPPMSALALRGRIAIYNDLERNKEYEEELQEFYDMDEVSDLEWMSYMPTYRDSDKWQMRSRKPNGYYSNYRTEIQGLSEQFTGFGNTNSNFMDFAYWKAQIDLARQNAENAQKTDWEILREIRGSQKLTEGRVELIGERTYQLNYSAIVQNTYNTNEQIEPKYRVMGQQGGYSYTELEVEPFNYTEFIEDGFVHIIATVWAESVYSTGIDRQLLNIHEKDLYRPERIQEKFDVLYLAEMDNSNDISESSYNMEVVGYKRRFSEIFKLPNVVKGDMLSRGYYVTDEMSDTVFYAGVEIEPNDTYQFFETAINKDLVLVNSAAKVWLYFDKKIWKDYTDLLINKNLAIQEESVITKDSGGITNNSSLRIKGQNQIFYVGRAEMYCTLPVDPSIQDNYTTWGEE